MKKAWRDHRNGVKKTCSADPAMPIGRKRYSLVIVFYVSATFVLRVNIEDDGIDTRLT